METCFTIVNSEIAVKKKFEEGVNFKYCCFIVAHLIVKVSFVPWMVVWIVLINLIKSSDQSLGV